MPVIRESIPPGLQQLMELGVQKKLWSLWIRYNVAGENETKLMRKRNMTVAEIMNFRENMFRLGFKVMVEPGHWKIICPMDIVEVDLYQQDAYHFDPPFNFAK